MAQRVRVVVELTDDLNGKPATQTIEYTWDGVDYVIDLTDANAARLRRQMAKWTEHSRPATGSGEKPDVVKLAAEAAESAGVEASAKEVRAWARANGLAVGKSGYIPADIRRAYQLAHADERQTA